MEKREPSYTFGGNVVSVATIQNSIVVLKKKKKLSYHMLQQFHSWAPIWTKLHQKDTCTLMFISALLTIAKTWK